MPTLRLSVAAKLQFSKAVCVAPGKFGQQFPHATRSLVDVVSEALSRGLTAALRD